MLLLRSCRVTFWAIDALPTALKYKTESLLVEADITKFLPCGSW